MSKASELIEAHINEKSSSIAIIAKKIGIDYDRLVDLMKDLMPDDSDELYGALKQDYGKHTADLLKKVSKSVVDAAIETIMAGKA